MLGNEAKTTEDTDQRYRLLPTLAASFPTIMLAPPLHLSCTPPDLALDGKLSRRLPVGPSAVPWSVPLHLSPSLCLWYPGEIDQQVSNLSVHLMH